MYACEVLTGEEHSGRDSCIAMRQKAVMDASESVPSTSPYTHTHTQKRFTHDIQMIFSDSYPFSSQLEFCFC